jgi:hypothetical protein
MALDAWEGQAGARGYAYHARDIAGALALVASGRSYPQAAESTRLHARRTSSGVTWGQQKRRRMRRRVTDGQLVANWVDVFGPVIAERRARTRWPTRLVVDSVELNASGLPPRSFHVMVAVGYEQPFREPIVWLMRPFPTKSQASWEAFFDLLSGTPERIVADMDHSIENAVLSCFPRGSARPPTFHWSDFHVNRALANVLAPLQGQPKHPVMVCFAKALGSVYNWDAFVRAIEVEDQTGTPLPAALRWVHGRSGLLVRSQTINRTSGPYSTGPVEAVNVKLKRLPRRQDQPHRQPSPRHQTPRPHHRRTQRPCRRARLRRGHPRAPRSPRRSRATTSAPTRRPQVRQRRPHEHAIAVHVSRQDL